MNPKLTRVLTDLRHGGHALSEDLFKADPAAEDAAATSLLPDVVADQQMATATDDRTTPFGYLFPALRDAYPFAHLPAEPASTVVVALKALGNAMIDGQPADDAAANSTIPPIYTYWGQFIDHDLTANTDRDTSISITESPLEPMPPSKVLRFLRNLREPALNLDSLYGDGPTGTGPNAVPYLADGLRFELGEITEIAFGEKIPQADDLARDLPRGADKQARIGDGRNDENLLVAQLHVAFLRFHNAVVDWLGAGVHEVTFEAARDLVRWHYQWLVVHDFLPTIALPDVAAAVLDDEHPIYRPQHGQAFMPLEFSTAAFRFGHSMVRATYDHNRNFGRGTDPDRRATFDELFLFTGNGNPAFRGLPTLPSNWPIEWDRFVDKASTFPDRFARRIDTQLAPPLSTMANQGNDQALPHRINAILKRLAVRNLLRGYRLAIPSGQAVAHELGVTPLSTEELMDGTNPLVDQALEDGNLLEDTPLWFYILKESEVRAGGNSLGEVGSRIVCETIIGQLRCDPTSYLHQEGWDPSQGVTLPGGGTIDGIADVLRFAGVFIEPAP